MPGICIISYQNRKLVLVKEILGYDLLVWKIGCGVVEVSTSNIYPEHYRVSRSSQTSLMQATALPQPLPRFDCAKNHGL